MFLDWTECGRIVIVFDARTVSRDPKSMKVKATSLAPVFGSVLFFSLFFATPFSAFFGASTSRASTGTHSMRTVNDHRVQNLSCQNVTADSVARSIRSDVFSVKNHLPYQNWAFQYGAYQLAGCWSLSRFQRLYFYLREPAALVGMTEFSNQARSQDMYEDDQGWKAFPLRQFWFLPDQSDARWANWEKGWIQAGGAQPRGLARGLKPDIEYYQALRFHQLENIRYLKGPIARTVAENQTTWSDLSTLIAKGRKPLILLRPDRYYQHVVIVKRIDFTKSGAKLWVYDSNSPWAERHVLWDSASSMFTAFDVIDGMPVPDSRAPVGVFIVDQDENENMLRSLATHYRQVCARP